MVTIQAGWRPFNTAILLECLNPTEYQNLSTAKREYFRMIISSGAINFQNESALRIAVMENLFPEGTQTHSNLVDRLSHEVP